MGIFCKKRSRAGRKSCMLGILLLSVEKSELDVLGDVVFDFGDGDANLLQS